MVLFIGGCSFLFGDKIITTRFRAWQRFSLFMPELFYPLALCLSSFLITGQALTRGEVSGRSAAQGTALAGGLRLRSAANQGGPVPHRCYAMS
jgi:hypothetical protein